MQNNTCRRSGHIYTTLTLNSPGSPTDGIEAGQVRLRVCVTCLRIPAAVHSTIADAGRSSDA